MSKNKCNVGDDIMKRIYKIMIGIGLGGVLGFAYYYFIGCQTGACPITSNLYVSVAYGGTIGLLLTMTREKKSNDKNV